MINSFDATILYLLNGFVHRSECFDAFVVFLTNDGFQKGGVVVMLLWWAWFQPDKGIQKHRETLVFTMLVGPFALVLSRLISHFAPFRARPIYNPDLHLQIASRLSNGMLIDWNSFPSDHAVLFFTFAMGLFLVSRKIGAIAFVYVTLVVAFPRVYLGLHHPTDILAGALLGMGAASLSAIPFSNIWISVPTLRWMERHPAAAYTCFFTFTYQVANAFGWVREVIVFAQPLIPVVLAHK